MRWPVYFILAYLCVGLQLGLAGLLQVWGVGPNFVLMACVFIALNAPREPALLGCFALGLMQDLVAADRLGIYALSYGLFALVAAGQGSAVIRGNPLVHFLLTLVGGLITAIIILLHGWLPFAHGVRVGVGVMIWSAIYSALISPIALGILHRARKLFSFEPSGRRMHRRMHR